MPNLSDGTFSIEEIDKRVRPTNDVHYPLTGLICVENTHNYCSGSVVPITWLQRVSKPACRKGSCILVILVPLLGFKGLVSLPVGKDVVF